MNVNRTDEADFAGNYIFSPQTTITELLKSGAISGHLYSCFKAAGFNDFKSVLSYRQRYGLFAFLNIIHFGKKALKEIEQLVHGTSTTIRIDNAKDFDMLNQQCSAIYPQYSDNIAFTSAFPTAMDFSKFIAGRSKVKLSSLKHLTISDAAEVWKATHALVSTLLEDNDFSESLVYHLSIIARVAAHHHEESLFRIEYHEKIQNPDVDKLLSTKYALLRKDLSIRTQHILDKKIPTYRDAIEEYLNGDISSNLLGACGKKSIFEINGLLKQFFDYTIYIRHKGIRQIVHVQLQEQFGFLTEEQLEFVEQFKYEHLHLPMLYILYHHLNTSELRYETIIRHFHGIGCKKISKQQIAELLGLSFERIRQIITTGSISQSITCIKDWEHYKGLLDKDYFLANDAPFRVVREREQLTDISDSLFGLLCSLMGKHTEIALPKTSVYIKTDIAGKSRIKIAVKQIARMSALKQAGTHEVTTRSLFDTKKWQAMSAEERQRATEIITDFALRINGVTSPAEGVLAIKSKGNVKIKN